MATAPVKKINTPVCIYDPKDKSFVCADHTGHETPVQDENYFCLPPGALEGLL